MVLLAKEFRYQWHCAEVGDVVPSWQVTESCYRELLLRTCQSYYRNPTGFRAGTVTLLLIMMCSQYRISSGRGGTCPLPPFCWRLAALPDFRFVSRVACLRNSVCGPLLLHLGNENFWLITMSSINDWWQDWSFTNNILKIWHLSPGPTSPATAWLRGGCVIPAHAVQSVRYPGAHFGRHMDITATVCAVIRCVMCSFATSSKSKISPTDIHKTYG